MTAEKREQTRKSPSSSSSMAGSSQTKSAASALLILNLALYFILIVISSWAVNHAIERTHETASVLSIPARIFPIWFPMGNMATAYVVIFSLIAGIVGLTTSVTGLHNVYMWDAPNLKAASATSLLTWALTLLAMGFASKEIDIGWADSNLRTLEVMTIIASGTQMLCTGAIHHSAAVAVLPVRLAGGRV